MRKPVLIAAVAVTAIIVGTYFILVPSQVPDSVTNEPDSYLSCGCGCCGGVEATEENSRVVCLSRTEGDSIQDKIDYDNQLTPDSCAAVGCGIPTKYTYCD